MRAGKGAETIYLSGDDLIHTHPGGTRKLVRGVVSGFGVTTNANRVTVSLSCALDSGEDSLHQTVTVYPRN